MENKYFQPEISDIRIGYECEICTNYGYESFNKGEEEWLKVVIGYREALGGYTNEISDIINGMDDGYQPVRVEFLSKEKIEGEGWKHNGYIIGEFDTMDSCTKLFIRDSLVLQLLQNHQIEIRGMKHPEKIEFPYYIGECKSINELRVIQKLLNI